MASMYVSYCNFTDDLYSVLCSIMEQQGKKWWDYDLIIDGRTKRACKARNGEATEEWFPLSPELWKLLPEVQENLRQVAEMEGREERREEVRKRLENLPPFKRGGKLFYVVVTPYDGVEVFTRCRNVREKDFPEGVIFPGPNHSIYQREKYFSGGPHHVGVGAFVSTETSLERGQGFTDQELVTEIIRKADEVLAALKVAEENHRKWLNSLPPKKELSWEEFGHGARLRAFEAEQNRALDRSIERQWED